MFSVNLLDVKLTFLLLYWFKILETYIIMKPQNDERDSYLRTMVLITNIYLIVLMKPLGIPVLNLFWNYDVCNLIIPIA